MIETSSHQDHSAALSDVDNVVIAVAHKSTDEYVGRVMSRDMPLPSAVDNIDTNTATDRRERSGSPDSSQMNYSEPVSPSTVRDRRAAMTMDLIRKYEEQKRRWQEHRPFQQLRNHKPAEVNNYSSTFRNSFTKRSSSSMNDLADPFTAHMSTMPTMPPAEMMSRKQRLELEFESYNDEAASFENDDKESSRLANDIFFFNNVVNSVTCDECDEYAASESRSFTDGTGTDAEQLTPNWKTSLDSARIDNINFANRRRFQSKELSLADISVGTSLTSLSRLSAPGLMEGVKEIQPVGGPKYYVMVNTKIGQAKIVHEAMPAAGREGFKVAMEEKGFEIIEYDLLPGRHQHHSKKYGNHSSGMEGLKLAIKENEYAVQEYDQSSAFQSPTNHGDMSKMRKLNPRNNSDELTGELTKKKTVESTRSRRAVESLLRPKVDIFKSWLENEINNVLDVADRIDNVLTGGCSMSNQEVFDDDYGTDCSSRILTFDSETDIEYNDQKNKRHSSSSNRRRNIKSGRTPRRRRHHSPSWHSDDETYFDDEERDINDHDIRYNVGMLSSLSTPRGYDKAGIRPTRSKSEEPHRTMMV